MMVRATPAARPRTRWRFAVGAIVLTLIVAPAAVGAQGLVKGVQQGAQAGNKAAGPVGGVLGGAIGGVVGVFTGVLGVGNSNNTQPPAKDAKDSKQPPAAAKTSKETTKEAAKEPPKETPKTAAKATNGSQAKQEPVVLTQPGEPQLTAGQIVANNDSLIDKIKAELNLTPEQERNWYGFSSAMHYLGHNGAERLNLRIARAKRDPPDDIIEQMRNEAQFLVDRAADQRNVADAAEPLYSSLTDKQKQIFIDEMVRLSRERGLD